MWVTCWNEINTAMSGGIERFCGDAWQFVVSFLRGLIVGL